MKEKGRVYLKYEQQKDAGVELDFEGVSKEELFDLYASNTQQVIAELFDVSPKKVENKIRKYEITLRGIEMEKIRMEAIKLCESFLNSGGEERLLEARTQVVEENFDPLRKGIIINVINEYLKI